MSEMIPREGMMATVRNRRAMITRVHPFDAGEAGRRHLVEVEYADGVGAETEALLWEVEPQVELLEPSALPAVDDEPPMDPLEFDALVRASRWSALIPSLPFSGLDEDRPPLAAPLHGAIYPEAYQLVPVLRALEMPRVALMLADAVGLGKTIQAGMVMRELMLRRRIRRILVLCPASLRTQWQEEMLEKFSLPFELVDRARTLKLQREIGVDANPWRTHERIIASYHYLKQPAVLEAFRSAAEPGEDGRLRWDLLVVDEAHNLSPAPYGQDSDLSRMLQQISPWFEHRIFLTATPHNGHTRSFSGLLEILDPVRFTRTSELTPAQRARVGETVVRRLKRDINASYTEHGEPPRFSDRHVEALPPLRFGPLEQSLLRSFHRFRKALRDLVVGAPQQVGRASRQQASQQERTAAMFALEVLQKRLLSGPWAFGQSWLALLEGLEQEETATAGTVARARAAQAEDIDDDAERETRQRHAERTVGAWLRQWRNALEAEIAEVTRAVEALEVTRVPSGIDPEARDAEVWTRARRVKADARLEALEALIEQHLRDGTTWRDDERLVVFTEYLATLEYVRARLLDRFGTGPWLLALHGGMDDVERASVKQAFNDPRHPARVLIATDAAGEGLNLQRSARRLLHWDIPWNPARMEQRNGRLDRHGQARDVTIYHFDSDDDASLRFLGKVLTKRSQTREDRVVTDEIFADAITAHFEQGVGVAASVKRLDRGIAEAGRTRGHVKEDLPEGKPLPGEEDLARLEELKAELDISPETLQETLETALAIGVGRPRLSPDRWRRYRVVPPVPPLWQELVDHTLREGGPTGPMLALVFDPEHYIQHQAGNRPVYTPEPDSRLLHLGHALYHRVMSTFARYRFPGKSATATRWTVRTGPVPDGADALVLLTVEELAVNALREPCHHWVRTYALPVRDGDLEDPLPHRPARAWAAPSSLADRDEAREVWSEVARDLKRFVRGLAPKLTDEVTSRLESAGKAARQRERERFRRRKQELQRAIDETRIKRLEDELEALRKAAMQEFLFAEDAQKRRQELADLEAELALRKAHYQRMQRRLEEEKRRMFDDLLPKRFSLRGEARVYPIAVEIRLPGGDA